jgi:hypothetical protein
MNILDLVVGKPIKTSDERAEQIGPTQGIPIFGLDALSSAAYGPEAALSLLIPLGLLGVRYIELRSLPSTAGATSPARDIEFAARLSPEVIALHVEPNEHSELLQDDWEHYVEQPFRAAGKEPPRVTATKLRRWLLYRGAVQPWCTCRQKRLSAV